MLLVLIRHSGNLLTIPAQAGTHALETSGLPLSSNAKIRLIQRFPSS
jgi:hypothetical protein